MTKTNSPVIKITGLAQVCFAVQDVEKTAKAMWETFGIGPWIISSVQPEDNTGMTYHGKPARFSFKTARTQNKIGGFEIELGQPLEGDITYGDYLKKHGEGVHHLGHYKLDSQKSFDEAIKALGKAGFHSATGAKIDGASFDYVDTTSALKTILEVVWQDPSLTMPFSFKTYP